MGRITAKMDIQKIKLALIEKLLQTEDKSLLLAIQSLMEQNYSKDFWNELSVDQKSEIEQGVLDLEKGNKMPLEDVLKKFE